MAIITEYKNYANTEIPIIRRDDFMMYIVGHLEYKDININGKTVNIEYGWTQFNDGVPTPYTHPEDDVPYVDFAIKSKKNLEYSYLLFRVSVSVPSSYSVGQGLTFSKNIEPKDGEVMSVIGITGIKEGNPRFAILEVGDYIGIAKIWDATDAYHRPLGEYTQYVFINKKSITDVLGEIDASVTDTEYGGISDADGYDPNFDNSSDIVTLPDIPSIGASNVGFINAYNVTMNSLKNLGEDLFPDFEKLTENPFTDNIEIFIKSFMNSNLVNYIVDCHCLPVTPTYGEIENIKIGFKSFPQVASRINSDYIDFDCGTLNIKEYYGNFIDYIGTRAQLYLPFIGFVPIKNEYFQNGFLSVKYRFNIIDGSFMCYVLSSSSKSNLKDTVVATYSGNACVHIPITGVNYSNMISGVVNGVASITASAMTGNVGGVVNGALNTLSCKPEMQSSNSYNSTSAFLGVRYPYLIIEREVSNFSEHYPNEYGLPLNVTKTISELSGFVQMDENIHININCMDEEKTMITEILTGGIII